MPALFPRFGASQVLDAIYGLQASAGLYIHLFANDFTPDDLTVLEDFDEANFPGYQVLGPDVWEAAALGHDGKGILVSHPLAWTRTADVVGGNTITTPAMRSYSAPGPGSVIESSSFASGGDGYFGWKAFDQSTINLEPNFWGTQALPSWLGFNYGVSTQVGSVIQRADATFTSDAPKDFSFEGSNDLATWTTILTPAAQTGWAVNEARTFPFSTVQNYKAYRTAITDTNGGSFSVIGQLAFMSGGASDGSGGGSSSGPQTIYGYWVEARIGSSPALGCAERFGIPVLLQVEGDRVPLKVAIKVGNDPTP